jgi:hypothetical protein
MADDIFPSEYQAQIDAAERRKKLALILQQRGLAEPTRIQQTGRMASKESPWGFLPSVISSIGSAYLGSKAEGESQAAKASLETAQQDDIKAYQNIKDPTEQLNYGQSSRFGKTRELAKAMQDTREKRLAGFGSALGTSDPTAVGQAFAQGAVPSTYQAPPNVPPVFGKTPEGLPTVVNTGVGGRQTGGFGSLPSKTDINLPGGKQESAAAKAVGEIVPKRLEEVTANARNAIQAMESADRISSLVKDPNVITGFGASTVSGLASLGAKLGFQGSDAAAKTQALLAEQANQTLAQVKKLPGAITEKERPFLELASAGKIDFTPEAITRLADIAKMHGHNTLLESQEAYNGTLQTPGAQETGVGGMYPFPKGWNFSADEKKYAPVSEGSNRYRYIGDVPSAPKAAGATPQTALSVDQLTPVQIQLLMDELKKRQGK